MNKSIWKETIRENADKEDIRLCDRSKEEVCTKKEESVPVVKGGRRGSKGVCKRTIAKRIYPTIKVTTANTVTNFIQLVSSQLVDRFSQTKLRWKAPNESYLHICRMYKSNNK